jgi:ribosome-binding protein aMBF1 (putative translation factor)
VARRGRMTTSYSTPSFEEAYTAKLNEIKVQLKGVLYGDNAFVVGQEYACGKCSSRIHLHTQEGRWLCLRCALRPGGQAPRWSKEVRAKVEEIIQGYPNQQQCFEEWKVKHPQVRLQQEAHMPKQPVERKDIDPERKEFGQSIKLARKAKGLTIDQLASQIMKEKSLSSSTIQMYESGAVFPPEYIMAQLMQILGLEVEVEEVRV